MLFLLWAIIRIVDLRMEVTRKEDKKPADGTDIPKIDSEEYILRKRLPRRLPKRPNDVYISRKTDFRAQLARQGETRCCHYWYSELVSLLSSTAVN